jgi:TetR/AcrR family transcriptional regulator
MPPKSAVQDSVRRRPRGDGTRAEIVAAAERHFAERGYEAARLEDIAADVGIRRAAIFYHFGDKAELYAAVIEDVFGSLAALPAEGRPCDRLEASLVGWIDTIARRPTIARLILREAASVQPGVSSPFVDAGRAPVAWFQAVIQEGIESGELAPRIDPHRFMSLIGATTVFHLAAMPWLTFDAPFDPWSPAELEKHKQEILVLARHMLGIQKPRRS